MEDIIKMYAEDGTETEFEFLDYVKYNGADYAVMLIHGQNTGEAHIFKVLRDEKDEEYYEYLENEEIYDAVFDSFKEKDEEFFFFE